jgi:hypothetical protein
MRAFLLCTIVLIACEPGVPPASDAAGNSNNPPPGGNPPPTDHCNDGTCPRDLSCAPVIDPSTLMSCAADAHCFDATIISSVDPMAASKLGKCTDQTQLCVPDIFLETGGKFIPKTCTSVAGAEGRCLSEAIPQVQSQASMLPQDVCATSEKCTPCYNPLDGTSTGACNLGCDTGPTKAPVTFAQCCSMKAHCVPSTLVPSNESSNVSQQECTTGNLCVPDQLLENQPIPTCTANSFILGNYTGVCLSNCLDFGIQGIALDQGSCAADYTCAPCTQGGKPTGAPGCPP